MKGRNLAEISIAVRHAKKPEELPDDLKEVTKEKCDRLEKFLRGEPRIEFVFDRGKTAWTGEAILHGSRHHERLAARNRNADLHACVENLVEKLERQLEKNKERRKAHRGPSYSGKVRAPPETAPLEEPSYEQIVKRELKTGGRGRGGKRK